MGFDNLVTDRVSYSSKSQTLTYLLTTVTRFPGTSINPFPTLFFSFLHLPRLSPPPLNPSQEQRTITRPLVRVPPLTRLTRRKVGATTFIWDRVSDTSRRKTEIRRGHGPSPRGLCGSSLCPCTLSPLGFPVTPFVVEVVLPIPF